MLEASGTLAGAIAGLAAGNVGTASVLGQIIDDPFAGLMILLNLERIGLRGEPIWLLYRDVHGMDLDGCIQHVKVLADNLSRRRA